LKRDREDMLEKANRPAKDAMILHPFYRGKIQTALKCPVRNVDDFAIWYTPRGGRAMQGYPCRPSPGGPLYEQGEHHCRGQ